jgi:hypothetical protein
LREIIATEIRQCVSLPWLTAISTRLTTSVLGAVAVVLPNNSGEMIFAGKRNLALRAHPSHRRWLLMPAQDNLLIGWFALAGF